MEQHQMKKRHWKIIILNKDKTLVTEQHEDNSLTEQMKEAAEPDSDFFINNSDVLMRKDMDLLGNPIQQLVVPTKHRKSIIEMAHAANVRSCWGKTQSRKHIKHFYQPGLVKQVFDFYKSCSSCQKSSTRQDLTAQCNYLRFQYFP